MNKNHLSLDLINEVNNGGFLAYFQKVLITFSPFAVIGSLLNPF